MQRSDLALIVLVVPGPTVLLQDLLGSVADIALTAFPLLGLKFDDLVNRSVQGMLFIPLLVIRRVPEPFHVSLGFLELHQLVDQVLIVLVERILNRS